MDELVTSLVERNIVKLTNIVENTTCPNSLKPEYLSLLATFLIQKAGCSPSPKTIEWLYFLTFKYPNILRDLAENFAESIHSMRDRFGSAEKSFCMKLKGKWVCFNKSEGMLQKSQLPLLNNNTKTLKKTQKSSIIKNFL